MTKAYIAEKIAAIQAEIGDDERQHSLEDKLVWEFVEFIASNNQAYAEEAREVLRSQDMSFARWCA